MFSVLPSMCRSRALCDKRGGCSYIKQSSQGKSGSESCTIMCKCYHFGVSREGFCCCSMLLYYILSSSCLLSGMFHGCAIAAVQECQFAFQECHLITFICMAPRLPRRLISSLPCHESGLCHLFHKSAWFRQEKKKEKHFSCFSRSPPC